MDDQKKPESEKRLLEIAYLLVYVILVLLAVMLVLIIAVFSRR